MIREQISAPTRLFLITAAMICIVSPLPVRAETTTALERLNRQVFEMNQGIMHTIVQPAMALYQSQVPLPARQTIGAVYANLLEPVTATAYALVGDIEGAGVSTARFAVNSTLGVLGAFDVAGPIGFPKEEKGFSEAVCAAGLPVGSYLVLPVIGSTTTGIAFAGATLMVGSTYALSFLSLEFALAGVAVDMIGMAAALQDTFHTDSPADSAYNAERRRYLDGLAKDCSPVK